MMKSRTGRTAARLSEAGEGLCNGIQLLVRHADLGAPEGKQVLARFESPEVVFLERKVISAIDPKGKTKIGSPIKTRGPPGPSIPNLACECRGIENNSALRTHSPNPT